jgi:hypothetical protein
MPHEVETMAYFGQLPWHGLGTALGESDLYDWPSAGVKAGLNWEAELVLLVTADTGAKVEHRAVRRKSGGRVLGVVGPRYAILQNEDAFRWFEPFLEAKEAALHTAGSLRNGSRIWVLAKLNRDPLVIAQGDEVEKFLLLSHGHDGSLAVRVGFTPVRVVCANTLAMAHGADASKLLRVKHTKDVHDNLSNIREVINRRMPTSRPPPISTACWPARASIRPISNATSRRFSRSRTTGRRAPGCRTSWRRSSAWPRRAGATTCPPCGARSGPPTTGSRSGCPNEL